MKGINNRGCKGDSRCEFKSTGFSSQIAVTKKARMKSSRKQTKLNFTTSINQMVIR